MNKKLSLLSFTFLLISLFDYKKHCGNWDSLCYNFPYGFFMLLKFIVCTYFCFQTHDQHQKHKNSYKLITCAILAFIYNPIIPVLFEKKTWYIINILTLIFIIVLNLKEIKAIFKNLNETPKEQARVKEKNDKITDKIVSYEMIKSSLKDVLSLPKEISGKILCINGITIKSLEYNLQFVPDEVLEIQYVKDAIMAYAWYYTHEFFSKVNIPEEYRNLTFSALLAMIFSGGIKCNGKKIKIKEFNLDLMRDKRFLVFQKTISLFMNEKIEHQTGLLVLIERYMEELTGRRVRYMEHLRDGKPKRVS